MKITFKLILASVTILLIQSCGLKVDSDSSCKSNLCKGDWQDFGGWGHHIKLKFNKDGTFTYNKVSMSNNPSDTPSGLPEGIYTGTWELGIAREENDFKLSSGEASATPVMTRHIKMSFNESTPRGKVFDVQLSIRPSTKYVILYGLPDSDQVGHYDGGNDPMTE